MGVQAVFINKGSKGFIGPCFLNYVLPKGLEVLKGPFEGGEGRDRVHEGTESEPVDAFRSKQQDGGYHGFVLSDFVLLIRSRGRLGHDGSAVLAGLHGGAQAIKGVFKIIKVQVVNVLGLHRVQDDFQTGVDPCIDVGKEDRNSWWHVGGIGRGVSENVSVSIGETLVDILGSTPRGDTGHQSRGG